MNERAAAVEFLQPSARQTTSCHRWNSIAWHCWERMNLRTWSEWRLKFVGRTECSTAVPAGAPSPATAPSCLGDSNLHESRLSNRYRHEHSNLTFLRFASRHAARTAAGFGMVGLAGICAAEQESSATSEALYAKVLALPLAAKHVIFLFMNGGPSHVDTFDPKPELKTQAGNPDPAATSCRRRSPSRKWDRAASKSVTCIRTSVSVSTISVSYDRCIQARRIMNRACS